nr:O-antigen ligase family protein [Geminicoccus flavidas]
MFSFETAFLLFLFAGRYKANPFVMAVLPTDPVIIFGALSIAAGVWVISTERLYIPGYIAVASFCVFLVWMWMSLSWTPGFVYARLKVLEVTFFDTWALIAGGMIIANSRERCQRFFILLNVFALILAIQVLLEYIRQGPGRIILINGGDGYLGYGRVCGLAAMTLFAYLAAKPRLMSKTGLMIMALLTFYVWVLLFGGGKGPLIAALVPLALVFPLGFSIRGRRIGIQRGHLLMIGGLIAAIGAILWVIFDPDMAGKATTINRFATLFSDNQGVSDRRRTMQIWEFITLGEEAAIFGQGIGAWPILTYGADIRHHPHSLPLEIIGELGAVGLVLFGITCFACLRLITLERLRQDALLLGAFLMTLNMALNAGTSGDLGENRYLFFTMGLLLVRPLWGGRAAALFADTRDHDCPDDSEAENDITLPDWEDDRQGFLAIRRRLSLACADDGVAVGRSTVSSSTL